MFQSITLSLLAPLLLAGAAVPASASISPSIDSARENAHPIFNAIHSAGRQWGSSYYHNGLSFFPAVMPKGTMMYHGASQNTTPTGPEWLAFEIEHAEGFARSGRRWRPGKGAGKGSQGPSSGRADESAPETLDRQSHGDDNEPDSREELRRRTTYQAKIQAEDDDDKIIRGYLHVYQAARDLNLLLIDGMSAGKTTMGTLDSQDLILRENATNDDEMMGERTRAREICAIMSQWGYDGVVRMEAGFEVVYCDFSDGLKLLSMTRTFTADEKIGKGLLGRYEWARAVAERYDGLGADRLRVDYSSMISGLFFPINISSTDPERPDLRRLASANLDDLKGIKAYMADVVSQPRRFTVNWQGITDLIISRFSKRLALFMSPEVSGQYFIDDIEAVTLTWFNAPSKPGDLGAAAMEENRTADAIDRCRKHYASPATIRRDDWSTEDEILHASIDTVAHEICTTLFTVRRLLIDATPETRTDKEGAQLEHAVAQGRKLIGSLIDNLGWTTFKQAQPCAVDEILFIAMWPVGDEEDHWHPGCRSIDRIRETKETYWNIFRPPYDEGKARGDVSDFE